MREAAKDSFVKWFTVVLVFAIIAGGLLFAWPQYISYKKLQRRDADLSLAIEDKRLEIARFVECQKRFKTDRDFVEAIARQNRRVYPGELVFVFDEKGK